MEYGSIFVVVVVENCQTKNIWFSIFSDYDEFFKENRNSQMAFILTFLRLSQDCKIFENLSIDIGEQMIAGITEQDIKHYNGGQLEQALNM